MRYITLLILIFSYFSCINRKDANFILGKTQKYNISNFAKEKDSLFLLEPIIIINSDKNTPYYKMLSIRNLLTEKYHKAIDQYFIDENVNHQFIIGNFTDYAKVQNVLNLFDSIKMGSYTFDSLPLRKGFFFQKNKFVLILFHQISFSNNFWDYDLNSKPIRGNYFHSLGLNFLLTIKTNALMIQNKTIVYYNKDEDEFNNFRPLFNNRSILNIYFRLLKSLVK